MTDGLTRDGYALAEALARAFALHQRTEVAAYDVERCSTWPGDVDHYHDTELITVACCAHCLRLATGGDWVEARWPCPTVRAITGGHDIPAPRP